MPKDRPRPERISMEERQRSHFSFSRASLIGRLVRATGVVGVVEDESGMTRVSLPVN